MTYSSGEIALHPFTEEVMASKSHSVPSAFAEQGYEEVIADFSFDPNLFDKGSLIELDSGHAPTYQTSYRGDELIIRSVGKDNYLEYSPSQVLRNRVYALIFGLGLPGLEQMVAYDLNSEPKPIVLTKKVDGITIDKATTKHLRQITTAHFREFLSNIEVANTRGLELDPAGSNVIHSSSSGLTMIDYVHKNFVSHPSDAIDQFYGLVDTLFDDGVVWGPHQYPEENFSAEEVVLNNAWLRAVKRATSVAKDRYS